MSAVLPSPCVSVCTKTEDGFCTFCKRTEEERKSQKNGNTAVWFSVYNDMRKRMTNEEFFEWVTKYSDKVKRLSGTPVE